jgi:integrase
MASLQQHRKNRWRVRWSVNVGSQQVSRTIHLPPVSARERNRFLDRINELISLKKMNGQITRELQSWIAGLPHEMLERLAACELITYDITPDIVFADYASEYIERRGPQVAVKTLNSWHQAYGYLAGHFGRRLIDSLTIADGRDFAESMPSLAPTTVAQHLRIAKQIAQDAVDREVIRANPFAKLKTSSSRNPERAFFVSREQFARVLAACSNNETRLILALSRFGGLRNPSEINDLEWSDINPETQRITIRKHKTSQRTMPLFPELEPYIQQAFDDDADGAVKVIASQLTSYSYRLQTIVDRSGETPWPRLFHNLRASRQTELEHEFPEFVVCKWLGNSPKVARDHYLQVTDDDFARASAPSGAPHQAPQNGQIRH